MRTEPMIISGLAGPVVIDVNAFTGGHSITVGGRPAARSGRRTYELPTSDGGIVTATVHQSLLDPYPSIEVGGVRHRSGPTLPVAVRALLLLPAVLIPLGGLLGAAVALVAVLANFRVAGAAVSTAVKVLMMLAVLATAFVVWVVLASVIRASLA